MKGLQERYQAGDDHMKCEVEMEKEVGIEPKIGGGNVDDENGKIAIRFV